MDLEDGKRMVNFILFISQLTMASDRIAWRATLVASGANLTSNDEKYCKKKLWLKMKRLIIEIINYGNNNGYSGKFIYFPSLVSLISGLWDFSRFLELLIEMKSFWWEAAVVPAILICKNKWYVKGNCYYSAEQKWNH